MTVKIIVTGSLIIILAISLFTFAQTSTSQIKDIDTELVLKLSFFLFTTTFFTAGAAKALGEA